jgi:hypothetical protein
LCCTLIKKNSLSYVVSFSDETTEEDDFTLLIGDEVTDVSTLFEKLLATNDDNFPVIMDFLMMNNMVTNLADIHRNMGFSFISSNWDITDYRTKWKLITNLIYLKENGCDLNIEMFNFLQSLTFGGTIVKRGQNYLQVIQLLLPFCTDFFVDLNYWKKIRYFCSATKEIIEALNFLIMNYGSEKNYKFLPPLGTYKPFTLKHLARNKVREDVWKNKKINESLYTIAEENLPVMLFKYVNFMD